MIGPMNILGIETSCDETAMAIIDDKQHILSHIIVSQVDIHKEFGGVVPEVAARNHLDVIDSVFLKTLEGAHLGAENIDVIAATAGPGLIGGVVVGTVFAKTLASVLGKPFVAVNHLEGHSLMCKFTDNVEFPFFLFLLSGGHCQILAVDGVGKYKKFGETIDDSLGETFDKVAQMLGLEYPGGPKIEQMARDGDENRFKFSKPLIGHKSKNEIEKNKFNFSFSGLKTSVRREIEKITGDDYHYGKSSAILSTKDKQDICASFQRVVVDILTNRLINLLKHNSNKNIDTVVVSGGVGANQYIKRNMQILCEKNGYKLVTPPVNLCTDNGVMVANVGLERFKLNLINDLLTKPLARWELEAL
ncbi:MAG: tRNA (adenosine(37)-N6)-threonylcarbamoyltransferase complex transferase subunit TsaD [Rickettsiales bacterium]|jgi:N6-L-threonylcarbamoyladenine synthase|nr:tRNA (adenosine(37)-N6)-threonylcarbamoyltransferase complex transferase subunit TsaD [Rickettsiales bacterium]